MATSVNLGDQLEEFIADAVRTGRYGSRSEVLREGVRLVQEREAQFARLRSEIQRGLDEADAGRLVDAGNGFDRVDAMLDGLETAKRR